MAGEVVDNDPLAISLIANVESAESKLMGFIVSDYAEKGFKPVSWDEMAEPSIPVWRERANERREWLNGMKPHRSLTCLTIIRSGSKAPLRCLRRVTNDQHRAQAAASFGCALTLSLYSAGWSLSALPGEPVVLESHGVLIKPFSVVEDLSSGDLDVDEGLPFVNAVI